MNSKNKFDHAVADARRAGDKRELGYREQAIKMYPHICGRCCREFDRKNLHELTVHHRDHNHDNNPGDGSNWELLCVYCHDNEHSRYTDAGYGDSGTDKVTEVATHNPFAGLASMMKQKK